MRLFTISQIARHYGSTVRAVQTRATVRGVRPHTTCGSANLYTARQVRKLGPGKRGRPKGAKNKPKGEMAA